MRRPNRYWTKTQCLNESLLYTNRSQWKKYSYSSYQKALKNDWIKECTDHMSYLKISGYWSIERCCEVAKSCVSRIEFQEKFGSAYKSALKRGWLNECCKHMIPLGSKYKRLIYAFEFTDNSVYVGLTYNSQERKNRHFSDKDSQVFKYIRLTGLQPEFKELTGYLERDIASKKEGNIVDEYRINGWNILNQNKTGGLGGGNSSVPIIKEDCINEAKKHKNRLSFQKKSNKYYYIARINNWLNECCKHMIRPVVWNKGLKT